MDRIYDGIVTSQNEIENNTCLNKIVDIDKAIKENTIVYNNMINKVIALDNTVNNLIKTGYYEMKLVDTTTHFMLNMFEFGPLNELLNPIEYIVIVPKTENSFLVRCTSYKAVNSSDNEYIYSDNASGLNPYVIIKATAIGNKGNQIDVSETQCELMEFELYSINNNDATKHIFTLGDNSLKSYKAISNKVANPMIDIYSRQKQEFDVYRLVLKEEQLWMKL